MKADLTTSILAAIFGFVIAFVVCNFLVPGISDFSFKTLGTSIDASLAEPDANVFNYRAINPTVEVYVGDCAEYNEQGECIEVFETDTSTPNSNNLPNNDSDQDDTNNTTDNDSTDNDTTNNDTTDQDNTSDDTNNESTE